MAGLLPFFCWTEH
uniref:Uncharacterized protein n=1 Tax=Anguilla anguilla TaxID=7936 RepID=A0A0E9XBV6_ANGAN